MLPDKRIARHKWGGNCTLFQPWRNRDPPALQMALGSQPAQPHRATEVVHRVCRGQLSTHAGKHRKIGHTSRMLCTTEVGRAPLVGRVPIMARRRTISSGKLALLDAMAATAPNTIVRCGGTFSCPVDCACTAHQSEILSQAERLPALMPVAVTSGNLVGCMVEHVSGRLSSLGWHSV